MVTTVSQGDGSSSFQPRQHIGDGQIGFVSGAQQQRDTESGAYRETMTDARLWPANSGTAEAMLNFFLLEKAFYEIGYELAYRPEWLRVPLAGTLRILSQHLKEVA